MCCLAELSRFVYLLNQQGFQPQYREIGKCVQHDTLIKIAGRHAAQMCEVL